ncbi:collagenase-like [Bombyx mandarina]|uniref:Peptidase S1 domain-containing protein n=2 Tax=Bombyx TaxID=7090 RepID=A0A8R2R498_BOMMO|nr:collagenase-like [Bombyx mandarina]XP_037873104.1 collagenase [Bombyx mori]
MRGFNVLALLALATAAHAFVPIETNYHEVIGIPMAMELKSAEEGADFDGARIVGGSVAGLGTHPHLAAMVITLTDGRTSMCGASLLSHTRSVTAAHCWRTRNSQGRTLQLGFGTTQFFTGGFRINTNNVQMHGSYNMDTIHNDVAMIIHGRVGYTNVIQPIFLPPSHLLNNQFVGTWAWAAGYGLTRDGGGSNTQKHQVALRVITNAVCSRTFNGIIASTLCVDTQGGRSTCRGDSGGPLAFTYAGRRTLIGITSFGAAQCQQGHPAGFARVTSFASWISARL